MEGKEAENKRFSGLDLINGTIKDNLAAGVVEPAISKIKSLRYVVRLDTMRRAVVLPNVSFA